MTSPDSSITTSRSLWDTNPSIVARSVVFPAPVAPEIKTEARALTSPSSTGRTSGATIPLWTRSSMLSAPRFTIRTEIAVQPSAMGGNAA